MSPLTTSAAQTNTPWKSAPLALLSGALFFLISTPLPFALLQWVAWLPLLFTLKNKHFKQAFFLGWLGGFALNIAGFYWIVHTIVVFSNLPLPVALFTLGLFAAYGALPYGLFFSLVPRMRTVLEWKVIFVAPAVWVLIEYLFPLIFPYHQGDLQYRHLALMQLVSITGVQGISFLVMSVNFALFESVDGARRRDRRPAFALIALALTLTTICAWGNHRIQDIETAIDAGPKARLGLIQGNLGVEQRRQLRRYEIFERYRRLSKQAVEEGATMVIWGEGASPYSPGRNWAPVQQLTEELNVDLITGGAGKDVEGKTVRYYNSVFGLHKNSKSYERYSKIKLLAFGEYVPFSDTFPQLKGKIKGIGDFTPGDPGSGLFVFDQPQGQLRTMAFICYEAILETFVRKQINGRANLLVNITHDAWFGDTSAPHQFLMLVSSRAIEHGVSIARVANTGISCVIDPTGRIRRETPLFRETILVEDVSLLSFATIYGRIGNLFVVACGLVTAIFAGVHWRRHRRKSTQ